MIIVCGINKDAGGKCYLQSLIFWSPSLCQWKTIFSGAQKKETE